MKSGKIIALLLALMLVFSLVTALTACGEDEPVADEPTTEDPTTDDPTTEDPTTEDPTEEEPTTEDPTTEDPTEEEPTVEDPTTEEPTVEEPTVEDPTTEDPTEEEPTVEDPTEEDPTIEDPTTEDPTTDEPTEEVKSEAVLVKDGVTNFKFVVADGMGSTVNSTVGKLVDELKKLQVVTEVVFDNAETVTACEVLIGTVQSRGEQYKLDPHVYGYEGYTVKVIDGKILILGGSNESILDAIEAFKKDILGITKKTKVITDAIMTAEQNIEIIQSGYNVESITVSDVDLRGFVIEADSRLSAESATALSVQELIYKKTGIWLPIVAPGTEYTNAIILNLTDARTCRIKSGFELRVKDGNIVVDCGFANKLEEATLAFVMTEIANAKTKNPTFTNGYTYNKVDYRNIYYKDFGAMGDGYTDDFFAIKACHDQANEFGHTVNASGSATYYIGKGSGSQTISVRTDTNWKGCKFIFDDSSILSPKDENGNDRTPDPECNTSIFSIDSEGIVTKYSLKDGNLPFETLVEGQTNIGFAPGYRAMIVPYDDNAFQFIRYGANADSGAAQTEIIMVDADGNIDPSTPVQWSYGTVTRVVVYQMEDLPITISGAEDGSYAHFETIFNGAPSYYTYYSRNIKITRANVPLKNVKHTITGEGETGAPYHGFITIANADNVVVEGCEFTLPKTYYTMGTGGSQSGMGTYELNATASNNVIWRNCTQEGFFEADGSIKVKGAVGTNYCKNLTYDNMFITSFDAHKGTYNATLRNSTCEHINFVGEGTITLENVTIHANASRTGMIFRSDYGATWQGDLIVNGLNIKYYDCSYLELGRTGWLNHYFGYQTYLPENMWLENVRTTKISWEMIGDTRYETEVSVNEKELHFSKDLENYGAYDISDPDEDMSKNPTTDPVDCSCSAGFVDSDANELCDTCNLPKVGNRNVNRNPYIPTKNIYFKNCPGLTFILPNTPQFENTKVYIFDGEDYVEVDWKSTEGRIHIPA